ncbi:MAG: hypothetical protein GY764_05960 [Halieaceae bacterium]|nr:hypothetical protein [Halieaceae bacterium]
MKKLTKLSTRQFSNHISGQQHAMAGATIAASAALACSLGEACAGINAEKLENEDERREARDLAARVAITRRRLLELCDQDGEAITAFAALREAGQELKGQEQLCEMPVEIGQLAVAVARQLQAFRPIIQTAEDDLEMAIRLLDGAARASTLLLDSNLRIWPDPVLSARFEPELAGLITQLDHLQPVERVR